jgi:hypothetical protein
MKFLTWFIYSIFYILNLILDDFFIWIGGNVSLIKIFFFNKDSGNI